MNEDAIPRIHEARTAFARHDWPQAFAGFNAAARQGELAVGDLEALAESAWWIGHVDEAIAWYERAYGSYLQASEPRPAALIALTIGFTHLVRGELALGSGWLGRAGRLLEDESDSPAHGYLAYVQAEEAIDERRFDEARSIATDLRQMGQRFADANLLALGVMIDGIVRIREGDLRSGSALLDEAMLVAVTERLDPAWAGNIYCTLMAICEEIGDYRRATEWTRATNRWCDALSAPGPFLGVCRMHRARIHSLHGAWEAAERDARLVCEKLNRFERSSVAEAHYLLGELARLRGCLPEAAAAYETARAMGRDPQPGYALHLLAGGHQEEAMASIEIALIAEPARSPARIHLRMAQVEIAVGGYDLVTARLAVTEIREVAAHDGTDGHHALACQAEGVVLLASGQASEALPLLRMACQLWLSLDATHEVARTRLLLARAYERLGDRATAASEADRAWAALTELGASHNIELPASDNQWVTPSEVTEREAQVLALVARGLTNREIGQELFISPHTVSRHLENIYAKLSIPTRAAAATWASEHGLGPLRDGSFDPMP